MQEFETRLKHKKPGVLSEDLKIALGMPTGVAALANPVMRRNARRQKEWKKKKEIEEEN